MWGRWCLLSSAVFLPMTMTGVEATASGKVGNLRLLVTIIALSCLRRPPRVIDSKALPSMSEVSTAGGKTCLLIRVAERTKGLLGVSDGELVMSYVLFATEAEKTRLHQSRQSSMLSDPFQSSLIPPHLDFKSTEKGYHREAILLRPPPSNFYHLKGFENTPAASCSLYSSVSLT